jgi:hypothetical protein
LAVGISVRILLVLLDEDMFEVFVSIEDNGSVQCMRFLSSRANVGKE